MIKTAIGEVPEGADEGAEGMVLSKEYSTLISRRSADSFPLEKGEANAIGAA